MLHFIPAFVILFLQKVKFSLSSQKEYEKGPFLSKMHVFDSVYLKNCVEYGEGNQFDRFLGLPGIEKYRKISQTCFYGPFLFFSSVSVKVIGI